VWATELHPANLQQGDATLVSVLYQADAVLRVALDTLQSAAAGPLIHCQYALASTAMFALSVHRSHHTVDDMSVVQQPEGCMKVITCML
jgi:hypothetical protein